MKTNKGKKFKLTLYNINGEVIHTILPRKSVPHTVFEFMDAMLELKNCAIKKISLEVA